MTSRANNAGASLGAIAWLASCGAADHIERQVPDRMDPRCSDAAASATPASPARPSAARASALLPIPASWVPGGHEQRVTPRCMAFAPARKAYACLGLGDYEGGELPRRIVGYVDLVGEGLLTSHVIRGEGAESLRAVEQRLAALGFTEVPQVTVLPADRWVAVDRVEVKLRIDLREGDASYEYFGDLTIRCPDGSEGLINVRKLGLELGETAIVAWAPGSDSLAVSVHGVDGGEGHDDFWINTVVVDIARLCEEGREAGVSGPVLNRTVGP